MCIFRPDKFLFCHTNDQGVAEIGDTRLLEGFHFETFKGYPSLCLSSNLIFLSVLYKSLMDLTPFYRSDGLLIPIP